MLLSKKTKLLKYYLYGKLNRYNGTNFRLSFSSLWLNMLSCIKKLSGTRRFRVLRSKPSTLTLLNSIVCEGLSARCLPTSVILMPEVLQCSLYLICKQRLTNIAVIARTIDLVNNIIQQMLRLLVFVFKEFLSSSKSMSD